MRGNLVILKSRFCYNDSRSPASQTWRRSFPLHQSPNHQQQQQQPQRSKPTAKTSIYPKGCLFIVPSPSHRLTTTTGRAPWQNPAATFDSQYKKWWKALSHGINTERYHIPELSVASWRDERERGGGSNTYSIESSKSHYYFLRQEGGNVGWATRRKINRGCAQRHSRGSHSVCGC